MNRRLCCGRKSSLKIFFVVLLGLIFIPLKTFAASNAESSVDYLASKQDVATGGMFEDGMAGPQTLQSGWAAMAFAASGYDPAMVKVGDKNLIEYITKDACSLTLATDIERTILALSAAGLDSHQVNDCDLIENLNTQFDPATGKIGPDIVSSVFGVLALSSVEEIVDSKTVDYLTASQKTDGGWDDGWGEEAQITAEAVQALVAAGTDPEDEVIVKAKEYLKSLQTVSGGIKYDNSAWTTDSDAFTDAYVLMAISALKESPLDDFWVKDEKSILDDLERMKNEDAHYTYSPIWGEMNPVWTTSLVVIALNEKSLGFVGSDLLPFEISETNQPPEDDQAETVPDLTPAGVVITPTPAVVTPPAVTPTSITVKAPKKITIADPSYGQPVAAPSAVSITAEPELGQPINQMAPEVKGAETEQRNFNYWYLLLAIPAIYLGYLATAFITKKK